MFKVRRVLAFALLGAFLLTVSRGIAAAEVRRHTLLSGTRFATELVEIDSGNPGPTVWVSGGVHGSELAGWQAAEQIARWRISRGRLVVVPHANKPAVQQQLRSAKGDPDLNRQFPKAAGQKPKGTLATGLWDALQRFQPDWVFDLHEALGNRNLSKDSVGQTIIVHPRGDMPSLAAQVVRRVNETLTGNRSFQVIRNPVHGSLAHGAGQVLGKNAAIVETSRMYALKDRVQWHLMIMRYVLEALGMGPQTASSGGFQAGPQVAGPEVVARLAAPRVAVRQFAAPVATAA